MDLHGPSFERNTENGPLDTTAEQREAERGERSLSALATTATEDRSSSDLAKKKVEGHAISDDFYDADDEFEHIDIEDDFELLELGLAESVTVTTRSYARTVDVVSVPATTEVYDEDEDTEVYYADEDEDLEDRLRIRGAGWLSTSSNSTSQESQRRRGRYFGRMTSPMRGTWNRLLEQVAASKKFGEGLNCIECM